MSYSKRLPTVKELAGTDSNKVCTKVKFNYITVDHAIAKVKANSILHIISDSLKKQTG